MRSKLTATALALLTLTVIAVAQKQPLAFEVASVKASQTTGGSFSVGCYRPSSQLDLVPRGMCIGRNISLRYVIAEAYDIPELPMGYLEDHLIGGPGWIRTDRFDIQGKAADVSASTDDLRAMLRTLLADRFKLQVHEQTKDESGFAVLLSKDGPKLTPTTGDKPVNVYATGQPPRELGGMNTSMEGVAGWLSRRFNRPVVDRTGLSGAYDFKVPLLTDEPPHQLNDTDIPAVAKGLEQLGLRLQAEKLPVTRIVIDHAEKPSEN